MEEKIREIVEAALDCKTIIRDEDYNCITYENFKQLPMKGDIIEHNSKKYEVIRREFDVDFNSYDYRDKYDCRIIVKCITKDDED